ncbi:hypothetical protein I6N95_15495 [Vagococcus sp. BWB3-3]|uniref:Uncharacterized protein n=1 Tax=Vagococcus allomyrinae TaxID=2794353 RepID=A0A940PEC7_9ENTE|nr:hypothetical protein [Vagococcus allomyrinae]MBP1042423.1 hypothetical protein [Vagococcus allomyrinae]
MKKENKVVEQDDTAKEITDGFLRLIKFGFGLAISGAILGIVGLIGNVVFLKIIAVFLLLTGGIALLKAKRIVLSHVGTGDEDS